MKKITESYLNERIRQAAKDLTPQRASGIWEQSNGEKAKGDEWFLDGLRPKKHSYKKVVGLISSVAACLVVCFLSFYMTNLRVDSTVYIDVNPGVMLRINCNDKVISAEAANHDGEIILEDMSLKNTDLNVAVNAILGSMVKHGYLSEAKDVILLSVDSGNAEKSETLRKQLSDEINDGLTSLIGACSVFDQNVKDDDELEELAEKYGITIGKASLLQNITDKYPQLDYSVLAKISMNDLAEYLADKGIDLRNFANFTGTEFDDAPASDNANPGYSHEYEDREEPEDDIPDLDEDESLTAKDEDITEKDEDYSANVKAYDSDDEDIDNTIDDDALEDDVDDDYNDSRDDTDND